MSRKVIIKHFTPSSTAKWQIFKVWLWTLSCQKIFQFSSSSLRDPFLDWLRKSRTFFENSITFFMFWSNSKGWMIMERDSIAGSWEIKVHLFTDRELQQKTCMHHPESLRIIRVTFFLNKQKTPFPPLVSAPTITLVHSLALQHQYNWGDTQPPWSRTLCIVCVTMEVQAQAWFFFFPAEMKTTVHANTRTKTPHCCWIQRTRQIGKEQTEYCYTRLHRWVKPWPTMRAILGCRDCFIRFIVLVYKMSTTTVQDAITI